MQYFPVMIVSPPLSLLQNSGNRAEADRKWFTGFSLFFILSFAWNIDGFDFHLHKRKGDVLFYAVN